MIGVQLIKCLPRVDNQYEGKPANSRSLRELDRFCSYSALLNGTTLNKFTQRTDPGLCLCQLVQD